MTVTSEEELTDLEVEVPCEVEDCNNQAQWVARSKCRCRTVALICQGCKDWGERHRGLFVRQCGARWRGTFNQGFIWEPL